MLSKLMLGATAAASGAIVVRLKDFSPSDVTSTVSDGEFLDQLQRAAFRVFTDCAHPDTGLVLDRAAITARDEPAVSSIAATGFGLTALSIGDWRGWLAPGEAEQRVRRTLRFIRDQLPHHDGFHFHFVDWRSGQRRWQSEISSIDTAILLCGVLTCRSHFRDAQIESHAGAILGRVHWRSLLRAGGVLGHGWRPESGPLTAHWDSYCEHMMLYLLAMGAERNAISEDSWNAWQRPRIQVFGENYISGDPMLFTHQFSHAWFDFRNRRDEHADYFENSIQATRAHKKFCDSLAGEFPQYAGGLWGITPSDSPQGYALWGGPLRAGPIDGTLVPCAAGGSLPFLPAECIRTLRLMRERHGDLAWGKFGFADAFNSGTGWVAQAPLAINSGITLLMAENLRSGFVWETFMRNPEVAAGMARAGFSSPGVSTEAVT
jgi:hypothetical protein